MPSARARQALHHRIVDRIGRARGERRRIRLEERAFARAAAPRRFAGRVHVRLQRADRREPRRRAHDEDAAVPPVVAGLQVLLSELLMRLLDEAVDRVAARVAVRAGERRADLDVAVARFRAARQHAERDDRAVLRVARGQRDRFLERARIGHRVIGGHRGEHGVAVMRERFERGERERGGRVARGRLEQDARIEAACVDLRGAREAMLLAADEQQRIGELGVRDAREAARGGGQRRFVGDQIDQLFRMMLARQRPEARAGAARENHGQDARQGAVRRGGSGLRGEIGHRFIPESAGKRPANA